MAAIENIPEIAAQIIPKVVPMRNQEKNVVGIFFLFRRLFGSSRTHPFFIPHVSTGWKGTGRVFPSTRPWISAAAARDAT